MKLTLSKVKMQLCLSTAALALCANFVHANTLAANNYGTEISNIATLKYVIGDTTVMTQTNEVTFKVQPPVVAPKIEFFRHSNNAANPQYVSINGSDYSPSGSLTGPFTTTGAPIDNGQPLNLLSPVPLIPADTYMAGELIFVSVDYIRANTDSTVIDTLVITIDADEEDTVVLNSPGSSSQAPSQGISSDAVTLRLYESGPNTGVFWAYVPSTFNATADFDPILTTPHNTKLVATYTDPEISTQSVVDLAVVNPLNTVFDSVTGQPVNDAEITIINLNTGQTASVYGVDGFSNFPSTLKSGDVAQDGSGLVYDYADGVFGFPRLEPGTYAIQVIAPDGYSFASVTNSAQINQSTGAAYFVLDASYGEEFFLTEQGSFRFDIPLDPSSELAITKVADREAADVGDFVSYTVNIQNRGDASVPVQLFDTLPVGFRYVGDTSRRNDVAINNPVISGDATLLTFPLGIIAPNETIELDYTLEIGPGGFAGDAVNRAVVLNGVGDAVSNIARAKVDLREDLMRSKSTIVGRVSENSCDAEQEWARDITRGIGVEGVRLYMETGAYAVSDPDGLFHFEGISEGTHVVQVDEETLPKGFELMTCEENTQYAGRNNSKFIDAQGGGIWRANFYLKQTSAVEDTAVELESYTDQTEYKTFDAAWLETQSPKADWVYPTLTPSIPSANIGIKHGPHERVSLFVNDNAVPKLNYEGRDTSAGRKVMLSRWRGVDLQEGRNTLKAVISDMEGNSLQTLNKDIFYATEIARATTVPDQSILVADGRTVPELAILLRDAGGNPVHAGLIANVTVDAPYHALTESRLEGATDMIAPLTGQTSISVGGDGIARIKLEPTLRTGKVTVNVTLENGRIVPLYMYLAPEKRDWIIVGLAEGSAGFEDIKNNSVSLSGDNDDVITDGRVAFFAKGLIKGNWLMTLGVDTDKRRGDQDGDFLSEIDPNAYYTLYGDRSYQEFEGVSRYPVFLKLEKRTAYAMFGDFDTDISEGRLTAYSRRLSGLKAEYLGESLQVLGFAAETNQGFAKDELAANGTSGSYRLSNRHILAQSEKIVIETRDRNRSDIILERKTLVRYLDYTLDYLTGELIFRLPVDATDFDFNPNVIVVDYETSENAERNITYGGRVQAQLADGKIKLGTTFISENGSNLQSGSKQNLAGVDVVAQITPSTEIRAEYAITEDKSSVNNATSDAILAEVIHTSEKLSAQAYFREEDSGFGLGQRNSNTVRTRRYGVNANLRFDQAADEDTGRRASRSIEASAYREENLATGDVRENGDILVQHQGETLTVGAGLRATRDELVNQADRESILGLAKASLTLPKHGATFHVTREQPLGGQDEVSSFPSRTSLGIDKTIGPNATASIRHDIVDGATTETENTTFGVSTNIWKGASLTASGDMVTQDSSRRLGSTVGLDQQVPLSKNWTFSTGARKRTILDQSGDYVEVAPDAAVSPFETNEGFSSAYAGLAYSTAKVALSSRVEARDTADGETVIVSATAARELSEKLSIAGAARGTFYNPETSALNTHNIDFRLGGSWRPRGEGLILLNRLDVASEKNEFGDKEEKIVNNLALNAMLSDRLQATTHLGLKHVTQTINGQSHSSFNQLLGGEARYDLTRRIDIGAHGSVMKSSSLDTLQYSYGPSIGLSLVENTWVSLGYNVEGFKDSDFKLSEYKRRGFFVKMRFKFDQNTLSGLLKHISPSAK